MFREGSGICDPDLRVLYAVYLHYHSPLYAVIAGQFLTQLTDLSMLNLLFIFLGIAVFVAFCFLFGRMAGDRRQGWAIFAAMVVMFVTGLAVINVYEVAGNLRSASGPIWRAKSSASAPCSRHSRRRPPPTPRTDR